MPAEYTVAVGDLVLEYHGGRRSNEGTVVKIGTKRVHVQQWGRVTQYNKETQQRVDGHPGNFMTLAQRAELDRGQEAEELLRNHGVELSWSSHPQWTVEQKERLTEAVVAIRNPPILAKEPS